MTQRRRFLFTAAAIAAMVPLRTSLAGEAKKRMRIGVIGSGRIGGTLGGLWARAGHEVMFSDRDAEQAKRAAQAAGSNARVGSSKEAAAFGDAVLLAVPYSALPLLAKELGAELKGKVMIDPNNPIPRRDGDMAVGPREKGAAVSTAAMFPGVSTFRAFNAIGYATLQSEAHRAAPKLAVPVAADDPAALELGMQLTADAGFEPVRVGTLAQSRIFDLGAPAAGARTAQELRKILAQ
ncbi:MAG: NADPH-dependent F420 reductase [Burkholderiales bacterium]